MFKRESEIVSLIYQVLVSFDLIYEHLSELLILCEFLMNCLYILLEACYTRFVILSFF